MVWLNEIYVAVYYYYFFAVLTAALFAYRFRMMTFHMQIEMWIRSNGKSMKMLGFLQKGVQLKCLTNRMLHLAKRYVTEFLYFFIFYLLRFRYFIFIFLIIHSCLWPLPSILFFRMGSTIFLIWRVLLLHFLLNLFKHLSMIISFYS